MTTAADEAAKKFDLARAGEYEVQSRIALAGYDGCHELAACMLAVVLGSGSAANILVVGAGGGAKEIVTAAALEPRWRSDSPLTREPRDAWSRGLVDSRVCSQD